MDPPLEPLEQWRGGAFQESRTEDQLKVLTNSIHQISLKVEMSIVAHHGKLFQNTKVRMWDTPAGVCNISKRYNLGWNQYLAAFILSTWKSVSNHWHFQTSETVSRCCVVFSLDGQNVTRPLQLSDFAWWMVTSPNKLTNTLHPLQCRDQIHAILRCSEKRDCQAWHCQVSSWTWSCNSLITVHPWCKSFPCNLMMVT